jgi:hypothetical protein
MYFIASSTCSEIVANRLNIRCKSDFVTTFSSPAMNRAHAMAVYPQIALGAQYFEIKGFHIGWNWLTIGSCSSLMPLRDSALKDCVHVSFVMEHWWRDADSSRARRSISSSVIPLVKVDSLKAGLF